MSGVGGWAVGAARVTQNVSRQDTMTKRIIFIVIVILVFIIVVCAKPLIFGSRTQIAKIDAGDEYYIWIWKEYPNLENWDPDIAYPKIYYEITQSDEVVVPTTWLGLDFDFSYDIQVAFAGGKTLVAVYDSELWDNGLFIIFDKESGESWPRLRDDEVSYEPDVKRKWGSRYNRLIAENPSLAQIPHYLASIQDK
jgi:hypothetical protein